MLVMCNAMCVLVVALLLLLLLLQEQQLLDQLVQCETEEMHGSVGVGLRNVWSQGVCIAY